MSESDTYRVVGKHSVFGAAPGETFDQALDPAHAERLIRSGAIERVDRSPSKPVGVPSTFTTGGPAATDKE